MPFWKVPLEGDEIQPSLNLGQPRLGLRRFGLTAQHIVPLVCRHAENVSLWQEEWVKIVRRGDRTCLVRIYNAGKRRLRICWNGWRCRRRYLWRQ